MRDCRVAGWNGVGAGVSWYMVKETHIARRMDAVSGQRLGRVQSRQNETAPSECGLSLVIVNL